MQYFAPQVRADQDASLSLRASLYRKKRKPGLHRHDEDDDSSSNPHPQLHLQSGTTAQSYASPASPELVQLRVAGLLPDDEFHIPPAPFPHAPSKVLVDRNGSARIHEAMAQPPSRLFAVTAPSRSHAATDGRTDVRSLKRTHLSVLSTIMHRCLLEGDYDRAGKAWGMILRTQVAGGNPVDPRNHGRWGIGAEILLRRKHTPTGSQGYEPDPMPYAFDNIFSKEGFELAREYFERLIVQHPNRKTQPHVVDERTFYPAMFSLWIFEVRRKSKYARDSIQKKRQTSQSPISASSQSFHGNDAEDVTAQEDTIRSEELERAMEIAERIDRLVVSPPFDKQVTLLHVRGHVGLWISDLIMAKIPLDEDWDMDTSMESSIDVKAASDRLTCLNDGQRELVHAQDFFVRAEAIGGHADSVTMSSITIRRKEIARQIAKLQPVEDESF